MPNLVSDKPISSEDDDVLGLTSFADALAKSLVEMAPDEGLVISIQGDWGSGKTSAIQLAQRRLIIRELAREKSVPVAQIEGHDWSSIESDWNSIVGQRRTHIVRFNPWNFSGQDNLVRAFFSEIGATIGHPPDGPIARAINKITDHLPNAGTLLGGFIGGAASHGVGIGAGATIGRAAGEGASRLLGNQGSLESAKQDLATALKEASKRIVVIIDDLDRLLPSEMRAMFSLVKSLGDLPGVFYVLSFDESAISRSLKSGPESIEVDFLEKIVQVPLRLPPPWQPEIRQLFFQRLNGVIGDAVPADEQRWRQAFIQAVAPYIRTPRDVARFVNTLQVIWPNVEGDVDLTDLIIITSLQLFEPDVYQLVFANIEELAGEIVSLDDDKKFAARYEPKDANNIAAAKQALARLFPKLAKGWNVHIFDGTVYLRQREQRRICTREYYRNYFLFGRDPDRVSRDELESVLNRAHPTQDFAKLTKRLRGAKSRRGSSRVGAFLDQVFELVFVRPLLSEIAVKAILDQSDDLIAERDVVWEFFVTDNLERLDSILTFGLTPLDLGERVKRIGLIAEYKNGLSISATVIDHIAGQHGLFGHLKRHENEILVPLKNAQKAVKKILARIRRAAKQSELLLGPAPARLLWIWANFSTKNEVKKWLSKQLRDDKSVLRLAEVLPGFSYQSGGTGQKVIRSFKAEHYANILDVPRFKRRLDQINARLDAPISTKEIARAFAAAEHAGRDL